MNMRTYIFTPREREAINGFLEGTVEWNDVIFRRVRARMVEFTDLAADVRLYNRLEVAFVRRIETESEAAVSA